MSSTNTTQRAFQLQKMKEHQSKTQTSLDKSQKELQKLEARCVTLQHENKEVRDELVRTKVQLQKPSAPAFERSEADDAFMQRQLVKLDRTQEEEDHALALAIAESERSVADALAPASPASPARAPCSKPASPEAPATIANFAPPRGCCGLYANLAVSSSSSHISSSSSEIFGSSSSAHPSSSSSSTAGAQCSKPQRTEKLPIVEEFAPPLGCNAHVVELGDFGLACSIHAQGFRQQCASCSEAMKGNAHVVELGFFGLACSIHAQGFRQECAACSEAMKGNDARAWAKEQPATSAAESPVAAPTNPTLTGAAGGPAAAPAEENPVPPDVRYRRFKPSTYRSSGRYTGSWASAEEHARKFCSSSSKVNAEAPAAAMPAGWAAGQEQQH